MGCAYTRKVCPWRHNISRPTAGCFCTVSDTVSTVPEVRMGWMSALSRPSPHSANRKTPEAEPTMPQASLFRIGVFSAFLMLLSAPSPQLKFHYLILG